VLQHISATLGANSGFDHPSMIELASSRILELGCAVVEGLPSGRCPILSRSSALFSSSASYEKGCQRQLSASRGAIFPKTLQGKIETDGYQKMSPLILSGSSRGENV